MKFKELLQSKKITQLTIANALGYKQSLISQWIRGDCEPNLTTLSNLSKLLNVSLEELLDCFKKQKNTA